MSGIVFNIQRFSLHDGPGLRTTVFLKGCSLRCGWCHNPEGLLPDITLQYDARSCVGCGKCVGVCPNGAHTVLDGVHTVDFNRCQRCGACIKVCPTHAVQYSGKLYTPNDLAEECLRDCAFYKEKGGVTFSGGEPLLQSEFVAETSRICKERGVPTVIVDTAGNVPWKCFENILPYVDAFLYDMKAFSEEIHVSNTGGSNQLILDNLRRLGKMKKDIYIRVPIIPSVNDSEQEISNILLFLRGIENIREVRLLPYHSIGREKYDMVGLEQPKNYGSVFPKTMTALQQLVNKYYEVIENEC